MRNRIFEIVNKYSFVNSHEIGQRFKKFIINEKLLVTGIIYKDKLDRITIPIHSHTQDYIITDSKRGVNGITISGIKLTDQSIVPDDKHVAIIRFYINDSKQIQVIAYDFVSIDSLNNDPDANISFISVNDKILVDVLDVNDYDEMSDGNSCLVNNGAIPSKVRSFLSCIRKIIVYYDNENEPFLIECVQKTNDNQNIEEIVSEFMSAIKLIRCSRNYTLNYILNLFNDVLYSISGNVFFFRK